MHCVFPIHPKKIEAGELAEQLATAMLPMYGYGEALLQAPFLLWDWRPVRVTCMGGIVRW